MDICLVPLLFWNSILPTLPAEMNLTIEKKSDFILGLFLAFDRRWGNWTCNFTANVRDVLPKTGEFGY